MMTFAALQDSAEWQKLAAPAEKYYTDDLPYHNWGHALRVAENVIMLANRCESRGMHLHAGLLAVAAAWHDAGYQDDHRSMHMPTKEAYSAHLAEKFLYEHGVAERDVAEVGRAIIGTTHMQPRRNINMLALHWADIADIGGPYERFALNSARLLRERWLTEPDFPFRTFVEDNQVFIGIIIAEAREKELAKLGEPFQGPGSFPEQALANIKQLALETETSLLAYESAA